MRGAADCCGGEARECERLAGEAAARATGLPPVTVQRTPRRFPGNSVLPVRRSPKSGLPVHVLGRRSRASVKFGRRSRLIREKIIGRDVTGFAPPLTGRSPLVLASGGRWAFTPLVRREVFVFLHQQARQHGRGILFEPRIQQLRDLLAKIGRVAQPGELVTLQRIAGRREKELPRRLCFVDQGNLQGMRFHVTCIVTTVNSTHVRMYCGKVCKSLARNCERSSFGLRTGDAVTPRAASQSICLRACSACSGDYEDPERTASSDASEEDGAEEASADTERSVSRDGFPVREK